jgi:hypothetical protein
VEWNRTVRGVEWYRTVRGVGVASDGEGGWSGIGRWLAISGLGGASRGALVARRRCCTCTEIRYLFLSLSRACALFTPTSFFTFL